MEKNNEDEVINIDITRIEPAEKITLSYHFLTGNPCKYADHDCDKETLWDMAEENGNPFCPHVCCRDCGNRECQLRCVECYGADPGGGS